MGLLTLVMILALATGSLMGTKGSTNGTAGNGDDKYDCKAPCRIDDPNCICGDGGAEKGK